MAEHNYVGQVGEKLAKEYLEKEGYKILEQNYKTKYAEIDLVCEKKEGIFCLPAGRQGQSTLVFVEVRTKVGENFGSPEDTINRAKLQKVLWNAKTYSAFKNWQGPCRIDAVCIVLRADFTVVRLTHHENIIS